MRILLSDGSSLTARQVATQLAAAGHQVAVLSPERLGLARWTRHVARVHPVPAYGADPAGWLEAVLAVLRDRRYDVLLPTQEQVALLAREVAAIAATGTAMPVPQFTALLRVQDKVAQAQTLAELGLPHPRTSVARVDRELRAAVRAPSYVKESIGTASTGVRLVRDGDEAAGLDLAYPVVVQDPVDGPLLMIQAIYDRGRLVAWHANVREQAGINGGAAVKRSAYPPGVARDLATLGEGLAWHGALSLDVILTPAGPSYIDINPRLVEPGNAWASGVDLLGPLLDLACGRHPPTTSTGRAGVRTHQLLLVLLGAAQRGGRRAVLRELTLVGRRRGSYRDSREELTPARGDPVAAAPVIAAAIAVLARPAAWRRFADGAVAGYALTAEAWSWIANHEIPEPGSGATSCAA